MSRQAEHEDLEEEVDGPLPINRLEVSIVFCSLICSNMASALQM